MRTLRILAQNVWYEIRTRINNREPLFCEHKAIELFSGVFYEAECRFVFEICGLTLEDDWLTFYIKPKNGLELPAIMKWIKQTFAQRYNQEEGRIGHIWGDRYWSRIVEGEPPPEEGMEVELRAWAKAAKVRVRAKTGVRPRGRILPTGVRPYKGKPGETPWVPYISSSAPG